ncbi:ZrgA family zinc uptake protein [Marinobacter sp.]|uniref:ZrgA family zinc uptake protein n=1 Tax=Marinobacter sp. TaxID=50741 RepID=UPI003B5289FD
MSAKCIPPNRPRSLHKIGCMIAACSLAPVALAADNPGAHEHGHARLQMAVEENRIDLMLNSPALQSRRVRAWRPHGRGEKPVGGH